MRRIGIHMGRFVCWPLARRDRLRPKVIELPTHMMLTESRPSFLIALGDDLVSTVASSYQVLEARMS